MACMAITSLWLCGLVAPHKRALSVSIATIASPHVRQPSHEDLGPTHRYVFTIVSAHRQGASYLEGTLRSLYCSLNTTSDADSPPPPVLLVNTQVPASDHSAATAVLSSKLGKRLRDLGLGVVNVSGLHQELHDPAFVLDLARRSTKGYKVRLKLQP